VRAFACSLLTRTNAVLMAYVVLFGTSLVTRVKVKGIVKDGSNKAHGARCALLACVCPRTVFSPRLQSMAYMTTAHIDGTKIEREVSEATPVAFHFECYACVSLSHWRPCFVPLLHARVRDSRGVDMSMHGSTCSPNRLFAPA
jgi:hypothetical protein